MSKSSQKSSSGLNLLPLLDLFTLGILVFALSFSNDISQKDEVIKEKENKSKSLQLSLEQQTEAVKNANQKLDQQITAVKQLTAALEDKDTRIKELQTLADSNLQNNQQAKQDIAKLQQKLKQAEDSLSVSQKENETIKKQNSELAEKISKNEADLTRLQNEQEQKAKEIKDLKAQVQEKIADILEKEQSLSKVNQKIEQAQELLKVNLANMPNQQQAQAEKQIEALDNEKKINVEIYISSDNTLFWKNNGEWSFTRDNLDEFLKKKSIQSSIPFELRLLKYQAISESEEKKQSDWIENIKTHFKENSIEQLESAKIIHEIMLIDESTAVIDDKKSGKDGIGALAERLNALYDEDCNIKQYKPQNIYFLLIAKSGHTSAVERIKEALSKSSYINKSQIEELYRE